jgi:hypothetical protein
MPAPILTWPLQLRTLPSAAAVRSRWSKPDAWVLPLPAYRWVVVGCQAATLLLTWPLWQVHHAPPMLPALPVPAVDLSWPLLLSLLVVLAKPLPGIVLHTALISYAVAIDQTRLQPEVVSLLLLLWGTLPILAAQMIARVHLITLWGFAGLHKLLSAEFHAELAPWLLSGLIAHPPTWLSDRVGYLFGATECLLGLLAILPQSRRLAAWLALGFHAGILLTLSPVGHHWNESVWPWNVALALSGFALLVPWRERLRQSVRACPWPARLLLLALLIMPLGYYINAVDAYLAHNLYSANTPRTLVCRTRGGCQPEAASAATFAAFRVPLPPEHRLVRSWFQHTCQAGDWLLIADGRWWMQHRGLGVQRVTCHRTEAPILPTPLSRSQCGPRAPAQATNT